MKAPAFFAVNRNRPDRIAHPHGDIVIPQGGGPVPIYESGLRGTLAALGYECFDVPAEVRIESEGAPVLEESAGTKKAEDGAGAMAAPAPPPSRVRGRTSRHGR